MAEEKISKIFEKKQDVDADALASSGGSLSCPSVESFESVNNSGINPESSKVPNDSQGDGIPCDVHPSPPTVLVSSAYHAFHSRMSTINVAA